MFFSIAFPSLPMQNDALARKIQHLQHQVQQHAKGQSDLAQFEQAILAELLDLGRVLTEEFIEQKKSIQQSGPPIGQAQERLHNKGEAARLYPSIFGMSTRDRRKYYSPETGSYYPLDAQLNLPQQRHSYLLQDWIARGATAEAFAPSLALLNEILGQEGHDRPTHQAASRRTEGSGMRWSRAGAQHVLDLRAVDKNGDWTDFSRFVKERAQPRIRNHAA